ncbi:monocarboxylate transporter 13-like isoform X2 [Mya arenaria]|uniref:monocarboxylate transporter 13-like isoform X2 n=1 Tax=Mya arenaria TaxID=6604 RepID=UPI0022E02851|nr:monocarboxylate transporter 13-like isoform X2 [Mya arenaria]
MSECENKTNEVATNGKNAADKNDPELAPDGGWGWVVTFAALCTTFIVDGISFSFGVFYIELLDYFGESRSLTSWIISVLNGTYHLVGPIASISVNIFGSRVTAIAGGIIASVTFGLCVFSPNVWVMIATYGFLGGFGLGLSYLTSIVTVGHYFSRKRALAIGIASCGSGIGAFAMAPLSDFLIQSYGWQGLFIPLTYLPDHARNLSLTSQQGTMLISIIGITNTVCRVIAGWVADRKWSNPNLIKAVLLTTGGVATIAVPWFTVFSVMVFYSVVYGLCIAVFVTYHAIIITSLFGKDKLNSAYGILLLALGIPSLVGPPIAGAISDHYGDYNGAFIFAGCMIFASGLLTFPLTLVHKWERQRKQVIYKLESTHL